jgi:radical SAM superfamily enzyme YgiQ (UPF0313 family)
MHEYDLDFGGFGQQRSIPVMTSRGCPGACKFCCTSHYWGRRIRTRSAANIAAEVDQLDADYPDADGLVFFDDTLTANRRHLWAVCELMDGYRFKWTCWSRIDAIRDRSTLERMHRAGCRTLSFGVESGSPRMLAELRKRYDREQVRRVFRWCRQAGIRPRMTLIMGMPGETEADSLDTVKLIRQSGLLPNDVAITPFTALYPGTPWFKEFNEDNPSFSWFGRDQDGSFPALNDGAGRLIYPLHEHPRQVREHLDRLVRRAYRRTALLHHPLYYLRNYGIPKWGG